MTKCQDDRAKTLEMHGEHLYRDEIFLYRTKSMPEWNVQLIDRYVTRFETEFMRTLKESQFTVQNLLELCEVRGVIHLEVFPSIATAYINSPWRKLTRLAKIVSGTQKTFTEYRSSYDIAGTNLQGNSRDVSDRGSRIWIRDYGDGNYQLALGLYLSYTGTEDLIQIQITPKQFYIVESPNFTSGIPLTPYLDRLDSLTPQIYPAVLQLPTTSEYPMTVRFSSPIPNGYHQTLRGWFYRPKGICTLDFVS